jgi:hypothetical protein
LSSLKTLKEKRKEKRKRDVIGGGDIQDGYRLGIAHMYRYTGHIQGDNAKDKGRISF